jgi:arylsulfatase A-like enzyme
LLLALAGLVPGCAERQPPADSAVLVTIDTWRADRFGAGGHPGVRTPHLDRFFRGGTQFAEAYSPVPTTLASHASMLSGLWPHDHGIPRNGWRLPDDVRLLPELLPGFSCAAFVSSVALDPAFGLARGFDPYDAEAPATVARDQNWRPARDTLARARAWWRAAGDHRFLWIHLFEPHFPYAPAAEDFALYDTGYAGPADGSMDFLFAMWDDETLLPPEARAHLESLYHAEITGMDRALGRFLRELASEPRTLVVVTADHGESLGEHGLRFKHGPHVYAGDVRVPLVVRGAEPFRPGVSAALVRTLDVFGTVLRALGGEAVGPTDSGDLADWVDGGEGLPVFGEASMPWNVEREGEWANAWKQRVVRTPGETLVQTPWRNEQATYDRRADWNELGPGQAASRARTAELERRLEEWNAGSADRPAPRTVDPELVRRLEALGYVE